ncbi:MAG: hypothetical protein IPG07_06265 [Crocinitomicaceae bacterium]|nr:hypothetical protein [Crocinitomicaceae bacterium]
MKTTIKESTLTEIKIEKTNIVFFNTNQPSHSNASQKLMSIELTDEYTRIDFEYTSSYQYINGGWINMHPRSFIRVVDSGTKYPLLRTENIPLKPTLYVFKASGVKHYYSLFFAAIPKDTLTIDIIELEAPGNYFNFYDVSLKQQGIICVDGNKLN